MIREVCVESLQEAVIAQELGAERIELCARLDLGGITPSYGLIESVKRNLKIPFMVMIRPRGGNFIYNALELKIMQQSIQICKNLGIDGIVLGILDQNKKIDIIQTQKLVKEASPLQVTFHKAIDDTVDPRIAVENLKKIKGITRILSSGGAVTALEGANILNEMISSAEDQIVVMAGGKVTKDNLMEVAGKIHTSEFHGRKIVGPLTRW